MSKELIDARLYGIQTSYVDVLKQKHNADMESLLFILRAMGADITTMDDVPTAKKMPEVIEVLQHVLAQRSRSLPL